MYNIVVKAVIFHKGKVLLLKRSDYQTQNAFEWDLPGGRLEPKEDPNIAIHREVLEESGIRISLGMPFNCFYWFSEGENVDKVGITYLAKYKSGNLETSFEHEHANWYDPKNLPSEVTGWVKTIVEKALKIHNT